MYQKKTNLEFMNKEVDEVDEVDQFASLEMRQQVVHESRDKLSDLRTCSSEDTRKGKSSLQAINAQLLDENRRNSDVQRHARP
jgi:hypothetical protein